MLNRLLLFIELQREWGGALLFPYLNLSTDLRVSMLISCHSCAKRFPPSTSGCALHLVVSLWLLIGRWKWLVGWCLPLGALNMLPILLRPFPFFFATTYDPYGRISSHFPFTTPLVTSFPSNSNTSMNTLSLSKRLTGLNQFLTWQASYPVP